MSDTKTVDVLAVIDELRSAAHDAYDVADADNFMELPDDRHDDLERRYGSKPRSSMQIDALTRLFNANWKALEARAAIAELIEAAMAVDNPALFPTQPGPERLRLRAAIRAIGGAL